MTGGQAQKRSVHQGKHDPTRRPPQGLARPGGGPPPQGGGNLVKEPAGKPMGFVMVAPLLTSEFETLH